MELNQVARHRMSVMARRPLAFNRRQRVIDTISHCRILRSMTTASKAR
jgi:hypothetical protein